MDDADRDLWDAWRDRRDAEAFRAAVLPHLAFARDLAGRAFHDPGRADEAVQRALVRLACVPGDRPAQVGLRAWLGRAVILEGRMERRAEARRARRERHAARPEPAGAAERSEVSRAVSAALDALPGPQREAVLLHHLHDVPYAEMARILGASEGACRLRVHKGIERLRARLGGGAAALLASLALLHGRDADAAVSEALSRAATLPPSAGLGTPFTLGGLPAKTLVLSGALLGLAAGAYVTLRPAPAPAPAPTPVAEAAGPASGAPGAPIPPAASAPSRPGAPSAAPPASARLAAHSRDTPPPGMVYVPIDGRVRPAVGTSPERMLALVGKRAKDLLPQLTFETPRWEPSLSPYFLDATEVSNSQYKVFVDERFRTTYVTGSSALGTLEEIAGVLVYGDPKGCAKERDAISALQLYALNERVLSEAVPDATTGPEGRSGVRFARLPAGLELVVYATRLPESWFADSDRLEGDAAPDLPVRGVSYVEAERYAEWAGKHIPTEAEWEWAARGPDGRDFPFEGPWRPTTTDPATGAKRVEDRVSWLDLGIVSEATRKPAPLPVDTLPDGRSWCGCFHMGGNVSEWTSSWFEPYPGWIDLQRTATDRRMNPFEDLYPEYVKVIRGASCADREPVALRLAFRNFVGGGHDSRPLPQNRFEYVGFRCAAYLTPGLDRLEPAISRLLRPKKVRSERFARDLAGAAVATRSVAPGARPDAHVFVTGGSTTILVVPFRALEPDPTELPIARRAGDLVAASARLEGIPFGLLDTDVPVAGFARSVRDTPPPAPDPGIRKGRIGRSPLPETQEGGTLAPGTYVLSVLHGRIAVLGADLRFVGFLDVKPRIEDLRVRLPSPGAPKAEVTVDPESDTVGVRTWVASGGKGVAGDGFSIAFRFTVPPHALAKAGAWRLSAGAGR